MIPNIEVIYILVKASGFKLIWFNIMRILIENVVSKCVFVAMFLGCTSTGRMGLCFFCGSMSGNSRMLNRQWF